MLALKIGIAAVVLFASVWWATRKTWDKRLLAEPENLVQFTPRYTQRRHSRIELELHDHRHWGLRCRRFSRGAAGWALHIGFGVGCLCVDFYRRGRRP